jgi:hypothetical protein
MASPIIKDMQRIGSSTSGIPLDSQRYLGSAFAQNGVFKDSQGKFI